MQSTGKKSLTEEQDGYLLLGKVVMEREEKYLYRDL